MSHTREAMESTGFEQIVIVGAGPIGLMLAIRLKKAGVKNAIVVDPRAGEYTRPGYLNSGHISKAKEFIGSKNAEKPKNKECNIKGLERILFEEAKSLQVDDLPPIQFIKKKFMGFSKSGIKVLDPDSHAVKTLFADIVFDATGSSRAVINEVNRIVKDQPFAIKPCVENPIKQQLLANVKITGESFHRIDDLKKQSRISSILQHTRDLEVLRKEFGWPTFAEPVVHCFSVNEEKVADEEKMKVCFYSEAPPQLSKSQQENWLRSVLKLKINDKEFKIDFELLKRTRKYKYKPRFSRFSIDPKQVRQVAFQKNDLPLVIPVGDAQIDPEFRLGIGILSGMKRLNSLLSSLVIKDNKIVSLDCDRYREKVTPLMDEQQKSMKVFYEERIDQIKNESKKGKKRYRSALEQVTDAKERKQIKQSLEELKQLEDEPPAKRARFEFSSR